MTGSPTARDGSESRGPSTGLKTRSARLLACTVRRHGQTQLLRGGFWLEKDALAGVLYPITSMYDVPLMVARGYASLWFLHSAAGSSARSTSPTYIYHLGDYDPSGVNAGEKIDETPRELAPDAEIHFERMRRYTGANSILASSDPTDKDQRHPSQRLWDDLGLSWMQSSRQGCGSWLRLPSRAIVPRINTRC